MGKYYCLIAGLPNIALDDSKLTYSISQFRQELDGILTKADKKLIDLFFLKFDNKNLIAHAKQPDRDPDPRGRITYDERYLSTVFFSHQNVYILKHSLLYREILNHSIA